MAIPDRELETLEYKLKKRGFKQGDLYHHECPSCHEPAVRIVEAEFLRAAVGDDDPPIREA